jgi:hypothetical protein
VGGSFNCLKVYKEREGHCRVPQRQKEHGFRLGLWVSHQRTNKPSKERRQLDELGFVWDLREADWEESFSYLKTYKEREGHCRVPAKYLENGFWLGQWVGNLRARAESVPALRRQQLNDLGFIWNGREAGRRVGGERGGWEGGFSYLKAYKEREGHCRVPISHTENSFSLGRWVKHQRSKKDTLSEEYRKRLDEIEFVWDVYEAGWEEGFSYLKAYKERKGHCLVPQGQKEHGFRLGAWVNNHSSIPTSRSLPPLWRQRHRINTITAERRQRLDELGFVWKVR